MLSIRLSKSDPVKLFPNNYWKNHKLLLDKLATYLRYGSSFKNREFFTTVPEKYTKSTQSTLTSWTNTPTTSALKRNKPESKYKSSVVFLDKAPEELGPNVKDPVTEKDPNPVDNPTPIAMDIADPNDGPPMVNPSQDNEHDSTRIGARRKTKMFLSKPLINPYRVKHTQKMKDSTRKHKTFVKIKLAKITSELISDQENEVLKCFRSVMDKIWELDATAIVVAWKGSNPQTSPQELRISQVERTTLQILRTSLD